MGSTLVDAHIILSNQPKVPFDEAKIYFDFKNHTYGLKMKNMVSVQSPQFCLHISNHVLASVHDFEFSKSKFEKYLDYLPKLPWDWHVPRLSSLEQGHH